MPILRYLFRTLVIVVLGMFNSLDSSALFCTYCDRVTISMSTGKTKELKFFGLCGQFSTFSTHEELKINSQKQSKTKNMTIFCDLTLKLMLNDWINEVSKHKQLLFLFFRKLCNFFRTLGRMFDCFFFCQFSLLYWPNAHPASNFPVDIVHNEGENFVRLLWKWRILVPLSNL